MLHSFARRPLWRSGLFDICLQSPLWLNQRPARRCLSTWLDDVKDVARESQKPRLSGRVHVAGIGAAGTFVAHALAARPSPPPITLLMHHPSFWDAYRKHKYGLSVNYNGTDDFKTNFDVEVYDKGQWRVMNPPRPGQGDMQSMQEAMPEPEEEEADGPIECLIVCARANMTERALARLKHRITSDSTVCLIQNGMGMVEWLNDRVFTDPATRPHYIQGVISHGMVQRYYFIVSHALVGSTVLSPVVTSQTPSIDAESDAHWAPSTKYLLRLLTLTPSLVATVDTPAGFMMRQLEKQVVNSIVHPLTAINECKTGELLYLFNVTRIMRMLLYEMSAVICALPELQGVPGVEDRFSPERLRRIVVNHMAVSADNIPTMLKDIQSRRTTEIAYLNGWFIRRGEEMGIKCVLNYMIKQLIHTKLALVQRREFKAVPIDVNNVILTGDIRLDNEQF